MIMDMAAIEKIRKEIERRMNDNLKAEEKYNNGLFGSAAKEDYDLLSFLDTIEERAVLEGKIIGHPKDCGGSFVQFSFVIDGVEWRDVAHYPIEGKEGDNVKLIIVKEDEK